MPAKYNSSLDGLRQKNNSITEIDPNTRSKIQDSVVLNVSQLEKDFEENQLNKKPEIKLLFMDITNLSSFWQFMLLTASIFGFYLIYGYIQVLCSFIAYQFYLLRKPDVPIVSTPSLVVDNIQTLDIIQNDELIFRLKEFRTFGWYLTLVQFACYSVFGMIEMQWKEDKTRRIPIKTYLLLAFLTVATMGLSNTSVGYLNYPTQVIFKCCKLIPVMLGGVLIQGKRYSMIDVTAMICKRYSVIDVTAVICMCFGLTLFTFADSTVSPDFNSYGVMLISLAVCADGAIGNVQEKALKEYCSSSSEMVLYSYSIGFVYIFCGLSVSGGLAPGFEFFRQHPVETYGYTVIFSLVGYFGLIIVLTMVKRFGALITVTVTTCRKAVTIILSFLFFAKPFTFQYVWSGLIVVLGIYLNIYSKNKEKLDNQLGNIYQYLISKVRTSRSSYASVISQI